MRRVLQFFGKRLLAKTTRSRKRRVSQIEIHGYVTFFITFLFSLQAHGKSTADRMAQSFSLKEQRRV